MNFYPHHIGDFRSGTVNMSRIARWIYRDMMDVYYDTEQPLPLDIELLCDMLGVEVEEERKAVERILRFKFTKTDAGYLHQRCEVELAEYKKKGDVARENGKKGGRKPNPAKTDQEPSGLANETGSQTNQEPLTNNHKPEANNQKKSKAEAATGTRLPTDWRPSPEDIDYCKTERPDLRPSLVATNFYEYWISKPGKDGRKVNWSATWRTWVRKETATAAARSPPPLRGGQQDLDEIRRKNNEEAKRLLGFSSSTDEGRTIDAT